MTIQLTDDGLEISTLEEIQDGIKADVNANVSASLNLTSTSALGQYIGATSSQLRQLHEALLSLRASWDPAQASGDELDRLGRLTGAYRNAPTSGTVLMDLDLDAGIYAADALVVSKLGDSTVRFANIDSVTSPGGLVLAVPFRAEETGPDTAPAGSLTVIANPIVGFNSANNPDDAIIGSNEETDAQFRRRRELELARKGSSTVDAIRADLLEANDDAGDPLFQFVSVVENDTDVTDGDGRPPHSFETLVVTTAASADIAQVILDSKPAGIQAYGLTTDVVSDSQGNPHTVGWSVADDVEIYMWVYVDVISGRFVGSDPLEAAVTEYASVNQSVGNDVIRARYTQIIMDLAGVIDVSIKLNDVNVEGTAVLTNWVIAAREIARFDATRITTNVTYVEGPP